MIRWDATPFTQACIWVGCFIIPWSVLVWGIATGVGAARW
jgi:hypothetical protein